MGSRFTTHLYLFLANLIYALSFTITKDVVPQYIGAFGAIVIRVTCAGVLFVAAHKYLIKEKVERKDFGLLILCGLFGVAINQLLFFKGLSITSPINAALMMTMTPILVLVLSGVLGDERITWCKTAGVLCGAAGAVMVVLSGEKITLRSGQTLGDILVLINAASYAVYLVIVKPLMKKYHPLTVITWVFIFGWLFVMPVGWSEFHAIRWQDFTQTIWMELGFIVVFTTFFAYLLNMLALQHATPAVVGIYIYVQPALATLFALLLNRDEYSLNKITATALIFFGVYLVSSGKEVKPLATLESHTNDPAM